MLTYTLHTGTVRSVVHVVFLFADQAEVPFQRTGDQFRSTPDGWLQQKVRVLQYLSGCRNIMGKLTD